MQRVQNNNLRETTIFQDKLYVHIKEFISSLQTRLIPKLSNKTFIQCVKMMKEMFKAWRYETMSKSGENADRNIKTFRKLFDVLFLNTFITFNLPFGITVYEGKFCLCVNRAISTNWLLAFVQAFNYQQCEDPVEYCNQIRTYLLDGSKSEIKQLYKCSIQFDNWFSDGDKECAICYREVSDRHRLFLKPCKHSFCADCITSHASILSSQLLPINCPICRAKFLVLNF